MKTALLLLLLKKKINSIITTSERLLIESVSLALSFETFSALKKRTLHIATITVISEKYLDGKKGDFNKKHCETHRG